ncbi:hypothetical protein BDR07DRAFT_1418082 [Suillus spraguei]|nr:hypothetical protein BDR07DRAFT_1418082 [Suillus spraguei]
MSVLGLITGALFVEYVSWSWMVWFVSTVVIPSTLILCGTYSSTNNACGSKKRLRES